MTLGSHQKTVGDSQSWVTPRWLLDALGPFDLDPCAADPRPWSCAAENYTQRGLERAWRGRVFLNPPFDRYEVGKWVRRLAEHGSGTALLHARTEADWFAPVWQSASGILFLADRIHFHYPDGSRARANSGAPAVLVAFSAYDLERLEQSKIAGHLATVWRRCPPTSTINPCLEGNHKHSPLGGSVAARVLRCPASVGLVQKVPAYLRKPSAYADRGTALHAATGLLLDDNEPPSFDSLVGKTFNNYALTRDDVENALRPAFAYVDALLDTPGAEFFLEHRVVFPTIAGAFGTLDLLVRIGDTVHVVDFKFGAGVRVVAIRRDGAEDVLNAQLMFYAAAARHSLPGFFAGVENIVLTIVQPVSIEPDAEMVSSVTVTHAELDEFITAYRSACEEALSEAPRLERGSHCRFCAARPICPAHTGPLLDLAQFAVPAPLTFNGAFFVTPPAKEEYLRLLAEGLALADAIKDIHVALRDQAKRALDSGDVVPGYALTAGRAERRWRADERTTIAALEGLGLTHGDIIAEELRSPKQVEIRAKVRGIKVPSEFISSHRSGTSLVRSENARIPVRGRDAIAREFSAALATFHGENNGKF
jgi:hypothetical protein